MSATSDDLLEELVEPGELAGRADQLAEVLDPPGRLDRVLGLQLGEVARSRRAPPAAGRRADVRHVVASASADAIVPSSSSSVTNDVDAAHGRAGDPGVVGAAQRLEEADALGGGERVELGDAGVADAALGHVEDPLDADLVGRVDDRPQVGHRVLDLAAVVEAGAADDLVRDAEAHHRLLDHPALGVRAVEHGDLAPVEGVRRRAAGAAVDATNVASSPSSSAW